MRAVRTRHASCRPTRGGADRRRCAHRAYLKPSNTNTTDRFGFALALSGHQLVIGAFGEDSAATGVDGNQADNTAAESGGTLHAFPFASQLLFLADVTGRFTGSTTWPTGIAPGTDVWFQFIVQDASTPHGISLSNGLRATTP